MIESSLDEINQQRTASANSNESVHRTTTTNITSSPKKRVVISSDEPTYHSSTSDEELLEDLSSDDEEELEFDGASTKSDSEHEYDEEEEEEEGSNVPLVKLFQKFLDREAIKKLKLRHAQLNSKLERLKKVVDPSTLRERGQSLRKEKERIKELIKLKKDQLNDRMNAPPFLRAMDKFAFTVGLLVLFISEFVLLQRPQMMYLWYTVLIFPLMAIRFIMYHRAKYHYFMLDFCYLCQVLLLFYLFGHQYLLGDTKSSSLFKLVFALSNGPLAWGTIVWRNSLVFHDVDKLTSVFIHLCPPIVTFCLRWYPPFYAEELACGGSQCTLSFKETYLVPLYLHFFWQTAIKYLILTKLLLSIDLEVVDGLKLRNDEEIMTSSRWMSVKQPHPLYKFFLSKGININPTILLMVTQLVYTFSTLITLPLLMGSFWLHSAFLCFIFIMVSWNGSCYYFEVFSESYHKRFKSDVMQSAGLHPQCNTLKISSITSFCKFLVVFLSCLCLYLKLIL
ncbi:transmembrane protein [Cavenderia fasciculata]|uniref:Glycerophosphocholine acyltransferase 1 n=1 Tax=Cavenderia fasciculata TaxID=261658 RepID=F4PKI4_CACFS|nr:uncharacterized protein DFA_06247 [Cavenderia fasciculata]EGG24108.1 transmembrane protein [Cavenderia fasciculata]|eukprot:XP_004361959.1 transmembrane protein [Cavenderia fasciculata]